MKKKHFVKIIRDFLDDIYARMKPHYLKQTVYSNGKEFVVSACQNLDDIDLIYDEVLGVDLLELIYKRPLDLFIFKSILYRTIIDRLVEAILSKDWYFVYTCTSTLSNVSGDVKIGVSLEKLEFIKESLGGDGDVYKRLSYLILNSLLEEKSFLILEEYKDFGIQLELEKIKREMQESDDGDRR